MEPGKYSRGLRMRRRTTSRSVHRLRIASMFIFDFSVAISLLRYYYFVV
jgi:hypothetical protein